MKALAMRILLLVAFGMPGLAWSAISCSVSSGGFSVAYSPTNPSTTLVQSSFTVTCTRGSLGDPASINFSVFADNGLNPNGQNNRASFGANTLRYDVYEDIGCSQKWKSANAITGTVTFAGTGTSSTTKSYWGCIAAGLSPPAGTYTDTVTMSMFYNGLSFATGAFPVAIATPATCSLTNAPGNIVFNYTAFGGAQAPATTFGVTCTVYLPYTMALDVTSGTLLGLAYTLALSSAGSTGTGAVQTHSITGSMAGGQSGTCASGSCTATQSHTLTITY